jgi:hypothetical protein
MPTITLQREEVKRLYEFCVKHKQANWFIAKDHGAYVGSANSQENCIFYFRGCNPKVNADWYETTHAQFGGDDFGELFPVAELKKVIDDLKVRAMKIVLTATQIKIQHVLSA